VVGEGRPIMRFNPHPNKAGTATGKRWKPAWPSSPANALPLSSPLTTPWPPSLVPTWKTTAWAGVCFSHQTSSGLVTTDRRDSSRRVALVIPAFRCWEMVSLGTRARAPPSRTQATKNGGCAATILSRCSGEEREPNTDTSQKRRAENATRSPLSTCLQS